MKKTLLLFAGMLFGITLFASGNQPLSASDDLYSSEMNQEANSASSDVTINAGYSGGRYLFASLPDGPWRIELRDVWKLPSGAYFYIQDGNSVGLYLPVNTSGETISAYAEVFVYMDNEAYLFYIDITQSGY